MCSVRRQAFEENLKNETIVMTIKTFKKLKCMLQLLKCHYQQRTIPPAITKASNQCSRSGEEEKHTVINNQQYEMKEN
jgi:hypothetical protein